MDPETSSAMDKVATHTNYSVLAHIYDRVMEDIDYEAWADFIDEIMQTHHPDPYSILELGCGTGILTLSLDELMCYHILATDKSPQMIDKAREKANNMITNDVTFQVSDFTDLSLPSSMSFDVVLLTFDGINYLHDAQQILTLFEEVSNVLASDGIFIFDFTTPSNSVDALDILDGEEGYHQNFYYHRESKYDRERRIHTNIFTIQKMDDRHQKILEQCQEVHEQRIYSLNEMEQIVNQSHFKILYKYGDFNLEEADRESLRVTMVLQCPQKQS